MAEDTAPSRTALLVMDVQNGIVARFGDDAALLERLAGAIAADRQAGMPVLYVVVRFRDGYPEISPRNRAFSALKAGGMPMTEDDAATALSP